MGLDNHYFLLGCIGFLKLYLYLNPNPLIPDVIIRTGIGVAIIIILYKKIDSFRQYLDGAISLLARIIQQIMLFLKNLLFNNSPTLNSPNYMNFPIQKQFNQQSIEKAQKNVKQTKDLLETSRKDQSQISPSLRKTSSPSYYDAISTPQYNRGYQKIPSDFQDGKKPFLKNSYNNEQIENSFVQQPPSFLNHRYPITESQQPFKNIRESISLQRPQKMVQNPKRNLDISPPRFFEAENIQRRQTSTYDHIGPTIQKKNTPERLQSSSSILSSKASPRLLFLQPKTRKFYNNEINIPEDLLKKNEFFYNQSMITLSKLEIKEKINKWLENSQKWVWRNLLKLFVEALINNVKQLDDILPYFGKIYSENDWLASIESDIRNGQYDTLPELSGPLDYQGGQSDQVSVDELLNYINAYQSRNIQWSSRSQQLSYEEFQKNHEKLIELIEERKNWDKYINIEGFKIYQVRYYILKRLLVMQNDFKQMNYNEGVIQNKLYPTDTQIIANITFNFVQDEINRKATKFVKQIYFNLGSLGTSPLDYPSLKKDEICFIQKNPPQYEPHFNLIFGGEELYCIPGKQNFFWALTLFSHCLSLAQADSLGLNNYEKGLKDMINNITSLQLTTSSSPFMIKSLIRNK